MSTRRDFLAQFFTGVVVSAATGKVLGQVVPKITENPDNTILAEYVLDLSLAKYANLATPEKLVKVTGSGIASSLLVMRLDTDGRFTVLNDSCTHEGGKMGSTFSNGVFTCILHSAQFDSDGKCKRGNGGGPATLPALTKYPYVFDSANNKLYLNRTTPLSVIDNDNDGYLVRNYPNPASSETVFEFTLDRDQKVKIELFDIQGRLIQVIADDMFQQGTNFHQFNVENLLPGSYTYSLRTSDGFTTSRNLTVIK